MHQPATQARPSIHYCCKLRGAVLSLREKFVRPLSRWRISCSHACGVSMRRSAGADNVLADAGLFETHVQGALHGL